MHQTPSGRNRRGTGHVQLLIVVALIAMGIVVALAVARRQNVQNRSVMCSRQLKSIGMAMLLYGNENRGRLPRTLYVPETTVIPVWDTGASVSDPFSTEGPRNDVSAAIFLLARTQDITAEIFVCPSSSAVKDNYGGGTNSAINRSNFSSVKRNLSYSIQNPYPSDGAIPESDAAWWTSTMSAEFAFASDMNPGTADGDDDVLLPTTASSAKDMRRANSNNHDGDGQNVLFGDGHVDFLQNPFVGVQRDNIFTNKKGQVVASPVDATDSVLLPTDD
jgi:hypothetical protein